MDHLKEAEGYTIAAEHKWQVGDNDHAGQAQSQLAIAHALIALVERLDKLTATDPRIEGVGVLRVGLPPST